MCFSLRPLRFRCTSWTCRIGRIPPARSSSEFAGCSLRREAWMHSLLTNLRPARTHHPPISIQVACAQPKHHSKGPICATLRANPCSRAWLSLITLTLTLCQHLVRASQCFVLVEHSDSPCRLQFCFFACGTGKPGRIPCSPILAVNESTIHQ